MERIKYRIWDSQENMFFKPIYMAYKGDLLDLSLSPSGEFLRRTIEYCSEHESRFPNRYISQQLTPFNDKNGEKIFDGDILSDITMTDEGPKKSHCQVYWCDDTGSWRLDNSFHQNKSSSVLLSSDLKQFEYEISGNIFENPELLVLDCDVKME